MKNIPFVTDDQIIIAGAMEIALMEVREDAGILFAGVRIVPGEELYRVVIGCSKQFEARTIELIAAQILSNFKKMGVRFDIKAHRGIKRS